MEEKLNHIKELAEKHEKLRNEMIQTLSAIEILENQYKSLESELYNTENEYVRLMQEISDSK